MSRLIDILSENGLVQLCEQADDKIKYTQFSHVGNLFRLIKFDEITDAGVSLVSKMLPELIQTDEKGVRALQASFNKIKKAKKITSVLKKEYFEQLFSLLIPFTNSTVLKICYLSKIFSTTNESSVELQTTEIKKIGKLLISNESLNLNSNDKKIIRMYSGIPDEPVVDQAQATVSPLNVDQPQEIDVPQKAESQPANPVSQVVDSKQSTEKIQKIKKQTDQVLAKIKQMTVDEPKELEKILETNTKGDVFKVTLDGNDTPVQDVVNEKLTSFYNETKQKYGIQIANFTTKLFSDCVTHLNSVNGYLNFVKGEMVMNVSEKPNGELQIGLVVGKLAKEHQFMMVKTFKQDTQGKQIAQHDKIQIPLAAQSSGINKKIFKDTLELYKAKKIDKITLQANVDVGGYAWFRYGFLPTDTKQILDIATWMEKVGGIVTSALKYDSKHISKFIDEHTLHKTASINNLIKIISEGKIVSKKGNKQTELKVETVIPKLFNLCADEFRNKYSKKQSFKQLASNIATMNFSDFNIGGVVFSISYKALLSIQALNVDGEKPIPMINDVYLDWSGELDMHDLDDTHAYLNIK